MADTICNRRREKIGNDNHFRQTLNKKNLFEAGDKIQVKNDAKKFQNPSPCNTNTPFYLGIDDEKVFF